MTDTSFHVVSVMRQHQPQIIDQVTQPDSPTRKHYLQFIQFCFSHDSPVRAHARSTLISGVRSNEYSFNKYCTLSSEIDKIISELFAAQEVYISHVETTAP